MRSRSKGFDPYAVLGISHTATADEIRIAYRTLVGKFHPDRHQGNPLEELAAARLAELNEAYEILSDPIRRANYDATRPMHGGHFSFQGRARPKLTKVIGLVLALFLIVRFFPHIVRLLEGLFRIVSRSLAGLRGTPFVVLGVLLAVGVLVLALVRWRRKK